MNLTPDRQGYLGDIKSKSVAQLQELLERQKKILSKRQFVEHLPDKGEKTKKFAEYIQELIDFKLKISNHEMKETITCVTKVEQSSSFENIQVESPKENILLNSLSSKDTLHLQNLENDRFSIDVFSKDICETQKENCYRSKDEDNQDVSMSENNDIVLNLEQMSLGSDEGRTSTGGVEHTYVNSFERIIRRLNEQPTKQPSKFLPNRSLKHKEIPKSHENKKMKSPHRDEESAVRPPHYKFEETKVISIEESVKLIEVQREKNEQLAAEWAAKKLAEQLVPKMSTYLPSQVDMEYRDTIKKDVKKDSDDEDSQDEYD